MKDFYTRLLLLFFLLHIGGFVHAQIKFSATASPENAGKDEYVTLRFTADNAQAIEKFALPELRNFIVVSGPNQESGMTSINGDVKQYIALSYILQPKAKGRIQIGAATAIIGGKVYKSNIVTITVSNTTGRGNNNRQQNLMPPFDPFEQQQTAAQFQDYILRKGENVPEKVSKNMQLRLQTDKTTVWEGQPVLAAYKLYTRLKSESSLTKNPSFNGFSVVDIPQNDGNSYSREMLNGREYNVYTIRKAQLYPLQSGSFELESATLENKIQFIKYSGMTPGGGLKIDPDALVTENVSLTSKPVTIIVKPLPEAGKPVSFKGAVGNFNIEAAPEKTTFTADETGKLIISINGKGNMQLLTAPEVQWPGEFEVYDTKSADNTDNTTIPISGSKTFEIPFTVKQPGNYKTPEIIFSYFDPSTANYKTVTAPPVSFTVLKAVAKTAENFAVGKKNQESFLNKFFAHRYFIILFLAGMFIFGLIIFVSRGNKNDKKINADTYKQDIIPDYTMLKSNGQNPLAKTEACLQMEECVDFYKVLSDELKTYFSQRFGLHILAVNAKTISNAMDKEAINNETSLQAQQLFYDIDRQLYTPFEYNNSLREMYARAQTVIQMINTEKG
jgi:hypothetical protein